MDVPTNDVPGRDFCSILQDCATQKNLAAGRNVHRLMQKACLVSIALYGDHLIHMFVACASLAEAEQVFWNVALPSVYTWNAIISGHAKLGKSEKALDFYKIMLSSSTVKPDKITLLCVVKACSSVRASQEGHLLHLQIIEDRFEHDLYLGNALIDMYAKCGALDDAETVFDRMLKYDVVSWGAIISGYAQLGHGLKALELFHRMYKDNTEPNKVVFLSTLKACACEECLQLANLVHQQMVEKALDLDVTIGNALIHTYAKCGSLNDARNVFDSLPCKTIVSWGTIIAGYANQELGDISLQLFQHMQRKGIKPNMVICLSVLKACGSLGALDQGKLVHRQVFKEIKKDVMVDNALIDMYSKCGCIQEAREVFDGMLIRDAVSYDVMIACYSRCKSSLPALDLLHKMQQEGITPNRTTLLHVLGVCNNVVDGFNVHNHIAQDGFDSDVIIGSALVVMYSKHESIEEAHLVFRGLSSRDVVAWGAIIAVYSEHGQGLTALRLYCEMQEDGVAPSIPIFLSALKGCACMTVIIEGRKLHDDIITTGFETHLVVGSSLIDMYANCGALVEARVVFGRLEGRDLVSWCSIMSGYAQHGLGEHTLELFEEMLQEGFEPDEGVLLSVFKACGCMESIDQCRLAHFCVVVYGFESNIIVGSTLLDLYAKIGTIEEAYKIFSVLPKGFSAPWNSMMAGYIRHGDAFLALQLLQSMQQERVELEVVIILRLLKVCASMGVVNKGRLIHDLIVSSKLEADVMLSNAVLDMYAKNGNIQEAILIFDSLACKDLVSWGTIITAYTQHCLWERVINSLRQMQAAGLKPTEEIFTHVLSACSHGGIPEEGYGCFRLMDEQYALSPRFEQYSGMVDLFSRAGWLDEAEDVLQIMPTTPDLLVWTSLLTSCKTYGSLGMGRSCYGQVSQLDLGDTDGRVHTSPIHGDMLPCRDEGSACETRANTGLSEKPRRAWIELKGGKLLTTVNQVEVCKDGAEFRCFLEPLEFPHKPKVDSKGIETHNSVELPWSL